MPILNQLHKIYTNNLMGKKFIITYDENGINKKLKLEFKKEHLKHILGLHKIPPYNEMKKIKGKNIPRYPAEMLYRKIANKTITLANIMNHSTSDEVLIRAIHFLEMEYVLNDKISDKIYLFDKSKFNGKTNINSNYILYIEKQNFSLHLGLKIVKHISSTEMEVIPETWFFRETLGSSSCDDYVKNQINYKIISIEKVLN